MMKKIFGIALCTMLAVPMLGCTYDTYARANTHASTINKTVATAKSTVKKSVKPAVKIASTPLFAIKNIKLGSQVAGLKVASIKDVLYEDGELLTAKIGFKGQTTISGTFTHYPKDAEFIGDAVSFEPDAASRNKIPQPKEANRAVWFLFQNKAEAAKLFGPAGATGKATIVIENYQVNFAPMEGFDSAKLVKVIKK